MQVVMQNIRFVGLIGGQGYDSSNISAKRLFKNFTQCTVIVTYVHEIKLLRCFSEKSPICVQKIRQN
jgi:hypothetical protein